MNAKARMLQFGEFLCNNETAKIETHQHTYMSNDICTCEYLVWQNIP